MFNSTSAVVTRADLRKTDTGWYTCKASSETGETTWSAALLVETPTDPSIIFHRTPEPTTFPGPPSKPSVADVTETTARVTWRSNPSHGASPVHSYIVEYFSHETGDVCYQFSLSYENYHTGWVKRRPCFLVFATSVYDDVQRGLWYSEM